MIGLFGTFLRDAMAPADLAAMAGRVSAPCVTRSMGRTGAAIAAAGHSAIDKAPVAESDDGRWQVAALGRLHNARQLIGADAASDTFDVASTICRLAKEDRLAALADANGLFCAAIVDRREHRLLLITDRLASYPIHVWQGADRLFFAGQIFVLLGETSIPRKADPDGLAQLFTLQRTIGQTTSVAGVRSIAAGTIMEYDGNRVVERQYSTLAWRQPSFAERDAAEHLAEALRNAVRRDVEGGNAGLLLSGGIDSRLILAAAPPGTLKCWTTASFAENPELAIAAKLAAYFGASHQSLIVDPADTLRVLEQTTIDSNGLYPASTPMSAFLPAVGSGSSVVLAGHGLDYTLRGYYLPARFVEIAGSRTRLPLLRPIPARPTGADVLGNLRQGPPRKTIERIIAGRFQAAWWQNLSDAFDATLKPWLESDEPYNAWDAFILHAVSKHYAFTSMMSVRAVAHLSMPAFDREVFDIYLQLPPAWRCGGRVVQKALRILSPVAARVPNANTHFRADLPPVLEIGALFGRAALRRIGLVRRPDKPSPAHSIGSWQDIGELYRLDAGHRRRFVEIRGRLDSLTLGVLNADGLATCIDEHLEGRAKHTKLLRQLLTHDAWVREFGIA